MDDEWIAQMVVDAAETLGYEALILTRGRGRKKEWFVKTDAPRSVVLQAIDDAEWEG